MKIEEFFTKYDGQGIDFDGNFGNQCVDLYRQYYQEVMKVKQSSDVGSAFQIWDTYRGEDFSKLEITPDAIPHLGDVLIWKKTQKMPHGHVSIFKEGNEISFISFDQNWPTRENAKYHFQKHFYKDVVGWL